MIMRKYCRGKEADPDQHGPATSGSGNPLRVLTFSPKFFGKLIDVFAFCIDYYKSLGRASVQFMGTRLVNLVPDQEPVPDPHHNNSNIQ